ncbi:ribbon-helix-helix domain-containing protein [Neopusillimonas aromaticivorans]|uniref:ribbon-helix-helix domain-containing protein n=1 Tax=Neopusillimonas aromaticivorans TaxID=2979868 RepID=UPI002592CEC1|nr:hypothetical protein [Neopusillimonas aromaticivorans]WJJ94915.1 hypothetical protein N7E01_08755 [Neopusillimonas aromaticivorans]
MPRTNTTTMTVRLSGSLSEFVATNVGEYGDYENVSEYVRDLIRRDKETRKRLHSSGSRQNSPTLGRHQSRHTSP